MTSLHQATDPGAVPAGARAVRTTSSCSWRTRTEIRRRIVDDLAGTTHDLADVRPRTGRPDLVDPRFVKGEGIPNAELRRYYSAADIVLNDHWDDMRTEGFISNRIYDALACGAFVISDHIEGIEANSTVRS